MGFPLSPSQGGETLIIRYRVDKPYKFYMPYQPY